MDSIRHKGILLRPWEERDAEPMAAAAQESFVTVGRWMPWCHAHYSIEDALAWIDLCSKTRADGSSFDFGVFSDDSGELLGGGGLNHFNTENKFCNLGYWVRNSRQRQGVAVRAAEAIAIFGFTKLGLCRIEKIVIAEGNEPSHGVARKLGATFECVARNRLVLRGEPVAASVYSLIPGDLALLDSDPAQRAAGEVADTFPDPITASESAK